MTEEAFNMNVLIPNIRKIVDEYDIHYNPEEPLSNDDELADRLFQAEGRHEQGPLLERG